MSLARADLEERGFRGFISFATLRSAPSVVPDAPGVYVVLHPASEPAFLELNPGGRFKQRDPTVPVAELRERWIDGCPTIYIGKGDRLRRRVREYADFGTGRPIGHWGGRLIWQLAGSPEFLVTWKLCEPGQTAAALEAELLDQFRRQHGRPPFANLR